MESRSQSRLQALTVSYHSHGFAPPSSLAIEDACTRKIYHHGSVLPHSSHHCNRYPPLSRDGEGPARSHLTVHFSRDGSCRDRRITTRLLLPRLGCGRQQRKEESAQEGIVFALLELQDSLDIGINRRGSQSSGIDSYYGRSVRWSIYIIGSTAGSHPIIGIPCCLNWTVVGSTCTFLHDACPVAFSSCRFRRSGIKRYREYRCSNSVCSSLSNLPQFRVAGKGECSQKSSLSAQALVLTSQSQGCHL